MDLCEPRRRCLKGAPFLLASKSLELSMRVAVIHDWLYIVGGAERVLQAILRCYPDADIFCLFDILPDHERERMGFPRSKTSFIQKLPFLRRYHRQYLPLMPIAIEQLDLSAYDLVISSSHAVAKGVLTGPDQIHISYVHSPMRYAWDLQHQYLRESGMVKGIKSLLARALLHKMRLWDTRTASSVDEYVANSRFIGRRIRKLYGRAASVIYPPVDVPDTLEPVRKEGFFLTASRLVPYKNTRAIVEAFRDMPDDRLLVAGRGPELERLKAIATPNVTFLGFVEDAHLAHLMSAARAFVFAAEEDFGIVVVEAQGRGTPIIAYGKGGVRETVLADGPRPTGLFFDVPEAAAIVAAVEEFKEREAEFTPENCYAHARRFATARFDREFKEFVESRVAALQDELAPRGPKVVKPAVIRSAAA
jgi:glycosyltransferase involved in cell wall biosynthesis